MLLFTKPLLWFLTSQLTNAGVRESLSTKSALFTFPVSEELALKMQSVPLFPSSVRDMSKFHSTGKILTAPKLNEHRYLRADFETGVLLKKLAACACNPSSLEAVGEFL